MAELLNRKVGDMNYDGLISDLNPPVEVRGRTIAHGDAEATYKRGTVFAVSENDEKIYPLGTEIDDDSLTPDCILIDDTVVGTSEDVIATVYTAGCFDSGKVTVKEGYTITAADLDELRKRNIVFKAAFN